MCIGIVRLGVDSAIIRIVNYPKAARPRTVTNHFCVVFKYLIIAERFGHLRTLISRGACSGDAYDSKHFITCADRVILRIRGVAKVNDILGKGVTVKGGPIWVNPVACRGTDE